MQSNTDDPNKRKESTKLVTNTLKLLKLRTSEDNFKVKYTKKDGTPREFTVTKILNINKTAVDIQTSDLEFKKLLIENITDISQEEKKDDKKQS